MPSPVGKQQLLRTQGLEHGDSAGHDYHLWFEGDTLYSDTKAISFVPGVVANESTFDNAPPLQAALNVARQAGLAGTTGTVDLPTGTYYIKSPIYIPGWVRLRGINTRGVYIKAASTFPTSTPLVYLGMNDGQPAFGSRVESLTLDCSNIAGSIGIYSNTVNELTGGQDLNIFNYLDSGIEMVADAGVIGGYNWLFDNLNLNPSASATVAKGVYIRAQNGGFGYGQLRRVTVTTQGGVQRAGIYVDGDSSGDEAMAFLTDIHVEGHTDGIYFGAHAQGYAIGVTAGGSPATVTAVRIAGLRPVMVLSVRVTTATNCIVDSAHSITVPAFWTGFYNNSGSAPYLTPSAGVPTPTVGSEAGASAPTPTLGSQSTDQHGQLYFGTGTGASPGNMVHMAFSSSTILNAGLAVLVSPLNSATAALFPIAGNISNTGFDVNFGLDPADSQGGTVYQVSYHVDASS